MPFGVPKLCWTYEDIQYIMRITNDYWVTSCVTWVGVLNLTLQYLSECRVFRVFVVVRLTLHLRSLWHVADATCGSNLCKSLGGRVTVVGSAVLSLHVRWMAQVFHGKKTQICKGFADSWDMLTYEFTACRAHEFEVGRQVDWSASTSIFLCSTSTVQNLSLLQGFSAGSWLVWQFGTSCWRDRRHASSVAAAPCGFAKKDAAACVKAATTANTKLWRAAEGMVRCEQTIPICSLPTVLCGFGEVVQRSLAGTFDLLVP